MRKLIFTSNLEVKITKMPSTNIIWDRYPLLHDQVVDKNILTKQLPISSLEKLHLKCKWCQHTFTTTIKKFCFYNQCEKCNKFMVKPTLARVVRLVRDLIKNSVDYLDYDQKTKSLGLENQAKGDVHEVFSQAYFF